MFPQGSWIKNARNYKIENNILSAELKNDNNDYILNTIELEDNTIYNNINGTFSTEKQKYFNEMPNNCHLDIRYGIENLDNNEIHNTLKYLLKEFMIYCKKSDIKPILMYGGLLGYYFNNNLLPWDDDIDLIILEEDIEKLKPKKFKDFIIEINLFSKKDKHDPNNKINARVISLVNGVFIDITYFYYNEDRTKLFCQDLNEFYTNDILPMKEGIFNDILVYLPNNIESCLIHKYGENSLKIRDDYNDNWLFVPDENKWKSKIEILYELFA